MNVFFIVSDEGTSLEHVHPLLSPIVSQVSVDTRCQMRTTQTCVLVFVGFLLFFFPPLFFLLQKA